MSRCLICGSDRDFDHEALLFHLRDEHHTAIALTSVQADARTRRARAVALATGGVVMLLATTLSTVLVGLLTGLFSRSRNLIQGPYGHH